MNPKRESPGFLAEQPGQRMHFKGNETQTNHTTNILQFPLHRSLGLLTLQEQCRVWRAVRSPRGDYATPLPEDFVGRVQ